MPRKFQCILTNVILITIMALSVRPLFAQTQQQIDLCANKSGNSSSRDSQITACTAIIQSGRWTGKDLAWAFTRRATAYFVQNNNERAIADYSQALQLDKGAISQINILYFRASSYEK